MISKLSREISRRWLLELALASQSAEVFAAHQHAQQARSSGNPPPWKALRADEAGEIEAIAAQIIPSTAGPGSDSTPGAREAGVIYFIDQALSTFDRDKREAYRDGLRMAQARRLELFPHSASIASLTSAEQQRLLAAIEDTEFFELVRTHTIMGFLGNPEYGGNRNQAGWTLIGFQP